MIGKPEWFKYRIFGWGVAPKSWQGWIYVAAVALILGFVTALAINNAIKAWIFGIIVAIIVIDILHIMTQLSKHNDERENYHQLNIERNCSFAAIVALIGVAFYQAYQNKAMMITGAGLPFDVSIMIVLGVMLLTKIISTAYVKLKM